MQRFEVTILEEDRDIETILRLAGDYLQELPENIQRDYCPAALRRSLQQALDSTTEVVFLLECYTAAPDGYEYSEVVGGLWGLAGIGYPWSDEYQAFDRVLFIKENRRGLGGFIKLINAYKAWAGSLGCSEVHLSSISGINMQRTEKLYNRLGFRSAGFTCIHEL